MFKRIDNDWMERRYYVNSIAEKIQNYHKHLGEGPYNWRHVETWVEQFPKEEQKVVLKETDWLLFKNYMGKDKIEWMFEAVWKKKDIMGEEPLQTLEHAQFLDIQTKGSSQKRMLQQIETYYKEKKGAVINKENHKSVKKYFYLDDCMYTGMTLLKDITNWMEKEDPNPDSELDVIFLGAYSGLHHYIQERLDCICQPKRINVMIYYNYCYKNEIGKEEPPYDILWPQKLEGDPYVDAYLEYMEEEKKKLGRGGIGFRKEWDGKESDLFTSSQERVVFEKALLKAGAYICSLPKTKNDNMKPMGYTHGISLGYGAFFVTDYNIANNCPLAFWWGSTDRYSDSVLSKWYPLLPREGNWSKEI